MSDLKNLPVRQALQDTFRAVAPRLAATFGVEPSALPLSDLSTADKLIAAISFVNSHPLFQAGYRMPDGSVIRQITLAAKFVKAEVENGEENLVGLVLKILFFTPQFDEPKQLGGLVIFQDDVAFSAAGVSIYEDAQTESKYESGTLSRLFSIIEPEGASSLAQLYVGLMSVLDIAAGTPSDVIRQNALQELAPFVNGSQPSQPRLPAPPQDPQADMKIPLSAELKLVLPELTRMADDVLGIDTEDDDSLTSKLYALIFETELNRDPITPLSLSAILSGVENVKLMMSSDGENIISAALQFTLTNDAGEVVDQIILGVASDVATPAAFSSSGLVIIAGDPNESEYEPGAFAAFGKPSETLSEAKAKANREMFLRALKTFATFTQDDAEAESLRRQATRVLKTVMSK